MVTHVPHVKVCGLMSLEDTLDAIELGADFLGFHLYPESKNQIDLDTLDSILQEIPDNLQTVGVFCNQDEQFIRDCVTEFDLDLVQLCGDESPETCTQFARPVIKTVQVSSESDLQTLLQYNDLDFIQAHIYVSAPIAGVGVMSHWDLIKHLPMRHKRFFLSGALTPENVEFAVHSVKPYALDVVAGVESATGKKDYRKLEEFIKKAKVAVQL